MSVYTNLPDYPVLPTEQKIIQPVLDYSEASLENSLFFSGLKAKRLDPATVKDVFAQYRKWRDQFHTWFGHCIAKSGTCDDPTVCQALEELVEHVLIELRDDHAGMYRRLLATFGMTEDEIDAVQESEATRRYKHSFRDRFGNGPENFTEAVIALSGRELFASLRNRFLSTHLQQYGVRKNRWLEVHEELELDHFRDTIRPFLNAKPLTDKDTAQMVNLIKEEITRHVTYWDQLLWEANGVTL